MARTKTQTSIPSTKKGIIIDDRGLPTLLRDLGPEEVAVLEKKLKRKIDWRMMPTMIILQIMNYLDRCVSSSFNLEWSTTDRGSQKCYRSRKIGRLGGRLESCRLRVSNLRHHPVCWVHPNASSFKSVAQQDRKTFNISANLYGNMGTNDHQITIPSGSILI